MSIHPTEIKLHQNSRLLEVAFEDGTHFQLPCEYLRVFSPSAEVRGHGPGTGTLVTGKEGVNITTIEPVGNYAVRLVFDDGHSTGLYSCSATWVACCRGVICWRRCGGATPIWQPARWIPISAAYAANSICALKTASA